MYLTEVVRGVRAAGRRWTLRGRFALARATERLQARLPRRTATVPLERVQRRLDLLLAAMYERPVPIVSEAPRPRTWVERIGRIVAPDAHARESMPGIDGGAIRLPPALTAREGADAAVARYRLLAIEQAERLERDTATHAAALSPLIRDLFLLREGAAVDARIARTLPGLAATLAAERADALHRRPALDSLTPSEREVELLLRGALAAPPAQFTGDAQAPSASLAWANQMAESIGRGRGGYRGLPPNALWGTVPTATRAAPPSLPPIDGLSLPSSDGSSGSSSGHARSEQARPGTTGDQQAEGDADAGTPDARAAGALRGDEHSRKSDPPDDGMAGRPSALEAGQDHAGRRGDALVELGVQRADDEPGAPAEDGFAYDEWDAAAGVYLRRATIVRVREASPGDADRAREIQRRHAALAREIRQQFERLRARRLLLGRQRSGDEIDLEACVRALVDRRTGRPADDRLYVDARPARRGVALALLADASGSTKAPVAEGSSIMDLEKIALLLAAEALDALGDLYAMYAFSGTGASNVRLTTLKAFTERNDLAVQQRIVGLDPAGFTRIGAAIRHATRQLTGQSAGRRLLLILSDGRPNDMDRYQGSHGVEDARQAIIEARASGVYPFCLTVDREAAEYVPRIFGRAGHTMVRRPEQLPTALVGAVRGLLRAG